MALSLAKKPNATAKVGLYHPATKEPLGALIIAGPDHEATKGWTREINDRRARRDYRGDPDAEFKEAMCRRTIGWEGVKDVDTGGDVPFDAKLLPDLYAQDWFALQVLAALGDEGFFFRE